MKIIWFKKREVSSFLLKAIKWKNNTVDKIYTNKNTLRIFKTVIEIFLSHQTCKPKVPINNKDKFTHFIQMNSVFFSKSLKV